MTHTGLDELPVRASTAPSAAAFTAPSARSRKPLASITTMPSPSTGGEEVVVGACVVLVVDEVVLLVVDDAGTLVDDGTVVVAAVVVVCALAPEVSARGTTNAMTATSTVAPVVIGVGAGEVRQ